MFNFYNPFYWYNLLLESKDLVYGQNHADIDYEDPQDFDIEELNTE